MDFSYAQRRLMEILKLKSYPIGLRLLVDGEQPQEDAIRPLRDIKHNISMCQAFTIARREGKVIAMMKEDNWCFAPVISYGMASLPERFLMGYSRYPYDVHSREHGEFWARNEFPYIEGLNGQRVHGTEIGPLSLLKRPPHVVIIYGEPAQIVWLVNASSFWDGRDIKAKLSGHAACAYAVAGVLKEDEPKVVLPCVGERRRAYAQDNELSFSLPAEKLEKIVEALEELERREGGLIPFSVSLLPKHPLKESYKEIAREIGIKID
jgi:uncharacterized protein (DUF169 family)